MELQGISYRFGRDINTDYIMGSRHRAKTLDWNDLARHIMEDIRPGFYDEIKSGGFIVADENFGCGSSREYAPLVIKLAGISAVLAKSFARIFYRNSVNLGLPVLTCDTTAIKEGDYIKVAPDFSSVENITRGVVIRVTPPPGFMMKIIREGGMVQCLKKYGPGVFEQLAKEQNNNSI
ncbi:MAG: 3-isopropylmalate dehydratase [Peptococcaceae bacterium]|jgi:3-isopropylmalate/(R)-2-methylmalate dehydratase small subunit|nr:3-isopropylmalate dehydratase [Peptococcaceae bacterium]MDH7523902.1 3-isopropylmalate dehydratase [Peptococcaceae bacterium]